MKPILAFCLFLLSQHAFSAAIETFGWTASEGAAGYKVYCGASTGNYTVTTDVGNVTSAQVTLNQGQDWYCAAKAYDDNDLESDSYSNEVVFHIAPPPPSSGFGRP